MTRHMLVYRIVRSKRAGNVLYERVVRAPVFHNGSSPVARVLEQIRHDNKQDIRAGDVVILENADAVFNLPSGTLHYLWEYHDRGVWRRFERPMVVITVEQFNP